MKMEANNHEGQAYFFFQFIYIAPVAFIFWISFLQYIHMGRDMEAQGQQEVEDVEVPVITKHTSIDDLFAEVQLRHPHYWLYFWHSPLDGNLMLKCELRAIIALGLELESAAEYQVITMKTSKDDLKAEVMLRHPYETGLYKLKKKQLRSIIALGVELQSSPEYQARAHG